ncbi:DUF6453 family protein [Enterobacter hormaechei]
MRVRYVPGSIWQIFPPGQRKEKACLLMTVPTSCDYQCHESGQCIWKGTVNVPTGGWAVPIQRIRQVQISSLVAESGNTVDFDGNTVRFFSLLPRTTMLRLPERLISSSSPVAWRRSLARAKHL